MLLASGQSVSRRPVRFRTRGLVAAVLVIAAGNASSLAQVAAPPPSQNAGQKAPSASSGLRRSPLKVMTSGKSRIVRPGATVTATQQAANRTNIRINRLKNARLNPVPVVPANPIVSPVPTIPPTNPVITAPPVAPPAQPDNVPSTPLIVGGDPAPVVPPILINPPLDPLPAPQPTPEPEIVLPQPIVPPAPLPDVPPTPAPEVPPAPSPTPAPEVPPAPLPPVDPPSPPPVDPPGPTPTDPINPTNPSDPTNPPTDLPTDPLPDPTDQTRPDDEVPEEGETFVTLVPGPGFDGPTLQPAAVGTPEMPGFDAKAIARWDVVPYQTFTGEFHVGVVAFHINGIESVDFSVDGGPWTSVREMQLNPQTNVWEYTATLNASDFNDGPIEVRAVAWPKGAGEPRVLGGEIDSAGLSDGQHSLILHADEGGSFGPPDLYVSVSNGSDTEGDGSQLRPYASIWKAMRRYANLNVDGLDIFLYPGEYAYGSTIDSGRPITAQGWVTIRPVPGAPEESVRFVSGGRFRVANIRLKDVVLDFSAGGSIGNYTISTLPSMLWLEGVRAVGPGPTTGTRAVPPANWRALYFNDMRIESFTDGVMHANIARNVHVQNLGSDAFTGTKLVANCSADDVRLRAGTSFHPDVYQFSVTPGLVSDNNIVYGLRSTNTNAQGLFADDGGTINNVAFVNVFIEQSVAGSKSQWKDVTSNHILFWNTTLVNQPLAWRTSRVTNISIVGCLLASFEGASTLMNSGGVIDLRHNHLVTSPVGPFGFDLTTGNPGLFGTGEWPFAPTAFSPLLGRLPEALAPSDSRGQRRPSQADAIGAFVSAETNAVP